VQTDVVPDRPAVAELLDLSPGVVKTQIMRALATPRALIGEDEAVTAPPAG
jgi:hypothetical protein